MMEMIEVIRIVKVPASEVSPEDCVVVRYPVGGSVCEAFNRQVDVNKRFPGGSVVVREDQTILHCRMDFDY